MNGSKVFCGGSIISPTFLITAAHCVNHDSQASLSFYAGKHRAHEKDPHEQKLEMKEAHIHEKFKMGNLTDPGDYDMALVELKQPIKFTEYIRPICLANVDMFKPGHQCYLSGWGYTNTTTKTTSNILQEVRLPLVSHEVSTYIH
jgi:secreted trypsin-like serine protease